MSPTIRSGETIHVEPVSGKVRRGDILLYRWERGVRAHRVAGIERAEPGRLAFILRGDAGGEDERVPAEKILGRVISLERDRQFVRRALRRGASRIMQAFRKSLAAR